MVVFFGCAGTWLWPVGFSGWSGLASVVAAHGLSCSAACGILVPWGGIEPFIPVLEGRLLTTGPWRNCQIVVVLPAHWLSVQEGGWKKGEGKYLLGRGISRAVSLWAEALFAGTSRRAWKTHTSMTASAPASRLVSALCLVGYWDLSWKLLASPREFHGQTMGLQRAGHTWATDTFTVSSPRGVSPVTRAWWVQQDANILKSCCLPVVDQY